MSDPIAAARALIEPLNGYTPGPWDASGLTVYDTCMDGVASCHAGADARLIAAAPALRDMAATLADALEAERDRAEKAEAERDAWIETVRPHSMAEDAFLAWLRSAGEHMRAFGVTICDDGSDAGEVLAAKVPEYAKAMVGRITDLEAELEQALARLAAVKRTTKCARCGSDGGFGCYECTPSDEADAQAALDEMLAEARLEGWRAGRDAAARSCVLSGQDLAEGDWGPEGRYMAVMLGARILALPEPKEASHD